MSSSKTPLLHSRLTYLTLSFVLLICAFPLISYGTTQGPAYLWWLGFGSLIFGGMIPPIYRVVSRRSTEAPVDDKTVEPSSAQKP